MIRTQRMDLPVALERTYGLFGARLMGQLHDIGMTAVNYHFTTLRHVRDEDDVRNAEDPDEENSTEALIAALVALGITFDTLLNETRLRNALRRIAFSNDLIVKRQLATALGRPANVDTTAEMTAWVDAQVERINKQISKWQATVNRELEVEPSDLDIAEMAVAMSQMKSEAERSAFSSSAAGLLLLNSALVAANALGEGIQTYVWRTELDERVRPHHADLEGTVQRFDSPPAGGGTLEGDPGNPGYGLNCRCVAEIVIT